MQFTLSGNANTKSTCLVIGLYEGGQWPKHTGYLDKQALSSLKAMLKKGQIHISGQLKQAELIHDCPSVPEKNILIVGLGQRDKYNARTYKKVIRHMVSALAERGIEHASTYLHEEKINGHSAKWCLKQLVLVVSANTYRLDTYKSTSRPSTSSLQSLHVLHAGLISESVAQQALVEACVTAECIEVARDLGNAPPNICHPTYLADYIKQKAKAIPTLKTRAYGEAALKKMGMNCLLAVGSGSAYESKLITMEYKGGKAKEQPVVLVGKGITFDSGGLNLKSFAGMSSMNLDMCGAANVIATLIAVATLKLPINVVGIVPSAENKTGDNAFRPSDILTSMSGQTIEVLNTDAEGRLVLCDALTYAKKYNPKLIIDIATLTGAIVVALGHSYTGLFCQHPKLSGALLAAGKDSDDPLWQMPLDAEHDEMINSKIADIANINANKKPAAGSSTAAAYLARFTNGCPWAHLDVAGTAMGEDGRATGRIVGMLVEYLANHVGQSV